MLDSYVSGWRAYDRTLRRPPASVSAGTRAMYWLSANVIKADEDKTYPGAFVASPTATWLGHPCGMNARAGYQGLREWACGAQAPGVRARARGAALP
jgi:GH15 family glucan-1,4-alpha-glucosidase